MDWAGAGHCFCKDMEGVKEYPDNRPGFADSCDSDSNYNAFRRSLYTEDRKRILRPLYYWRYYWPGDHVGDLYILFWRCRIFDLGTFESRISIFYEVNV